MIEQRKFRAHIDYAVIQQGVARGRIERSRAIRAAFAALGRAVGRAMNARIAAPGPVAGKADCAA